MPGSTLLLPGDEHGMRHRGSAAAVACPCRSHPDPATQPPLPYLRRVLHPDGVQFAHPAEREFARLLAYYRIKWVYEPTTFALRWGEDGRATECFTPDFFLPDHRLYFELTTMRQSLVTRKNRKLRHLRELYPGTRIRLLYRRDILRLEDAYGPPVAAQRLRDVLWGEAEIEARIRDLAQQVADEWLGRATGGQPPVLLAVGSGAARFQQRLAAALAAAGVPCDTDRLDPSRFRRDSAQQAVRAVRRPEVSMDGRRVLLVGDVVSTGLSLTWAAERVARKHAAEVRSCAFLDRQAARLLDPGLAWVGFEAPDVPLAGCGLSLHRPLRRLPAIGTVEPVG